MPSRRKALRVEDVLLETLIIYIAACRPLPSNATALAKRLRARSRLGSPSCCMAILKLANGQRAARNELRQEDTRA